MKFILEVEARGETVAHLTEALSKVGADLLTHHAEGEVEGMYKYALRMSAKDWDIWNSVKPIKEEGRKE